MHATKLPNFTRDSLTHRPTDGAFGAVLLTIAAEMAIASAAAAEETMMYLHRGPCLKLDNGIMGVSLSFMGSCNLSCSHNILSVSNQRKAELPALLKNGVT